ncbi:1-deoxy-D-xylulose-5-phosphate reductoisomerase [bacterium]|nr:1-deoxy-D-xylulose-5-phosphate reductoisomerase [bacterium]MBU1753051.1 1-deoxy-D-xylulose-5-phosphate reductoisomerase [bacterium]
MKRIAMLGSTGSIGVNCLQVIQGYPERFKVMALSAGRNVNLLAEQVRMFKPEVVSVMDTDSETQLRQMLKGYSVEILSGEEGHVRIAVMKDVDLLVSAMVGVVGLAPTIAAIKCGKDIALANKETLVAAGSIMMDLAREHGVKILPIDSEHSAIFQCIHGRNSHEIQRIILTASGGPFCHRKDLESITPDDALQHPTWSMGAKITIDSATLMNKGLEVIEAHHLFGIPAENIQVIVHPQSIIHSMVELVDGGVIAQLSVPDMKSPIAYCLSYPERLDGVIERLDLASIGGLTFEEPDTERFPCLQLAYDAIKIGGTMPAVLNAANEIAVSRFLARQIGFMDIPRIIKQVMDSHKVVLNPSLDDIFSATEWGKEMAKEL